MIDISGPVVSRGQQEGQVPSMESDERHDNDCHTTPERAGANHLDIAPHVSSFIKAGTIITSCTASYFTYISEIWSQSIFSTKRATIHLQLPLLSHFTH